MNRKRLYCDNTLINFEGTFIKILEDKRVLSRKTAIKLMREHGLNLMESRKLFSEIMELIGDEYFLDNGFIRPKQAKFIIRGG